MVHPVSVALLTVFLTLAGCASGGAGPKGEAGPGNHGPAAFPGELTRGLAFASRTGRNVLVEYFSETCEICRRMQERVLETDEVKEALARLVYVRMTKGKDAGSFEMRWRNARTPAFVVLRPDGRQLGSLVMGEIKKGAFLGFLAWARTGEGPPPAMRTGGA